MVNTEIIIDADKGQHGWEIVLRFTPEDMICAWTDVSDEKLALLPFNATIAAALRSEAERQEGSS